MSGETILLVEDNQILREGLRDLLEQEQYHVLPAGHGLEGLDVLKSHIPDLILSDINMPHMDGYAFFDAVRERQEWISIPIIFLTARREKDYVLAGKKLGVEDYLLKPVAPDELLTTIRSRLSRSQQLLVAQIQESYEASMIMLANAIEVRDPYTRGHVERVMNYALVIARQYGYPQHLFGDLRFGSILHDIGKIHIRENVLQKEGPLSDDEWVEMKQHPNLGVELLKDIHYLGESLPIILYHHERWDGQGYPNGLAGEEIPLSARIVTVADSFDAMTTVRPYRKVMPFEQAYQIIISGSGKQYDPAIVDAFHKAWEAKQIQEVFETY